MYVEYSFYLDQTNFRTETCLGNNRNPEFNYTKQHTVNIVTSMLVDYLEKELMRFRVYGFADVKKSNRSKARPTKKLLNTSADQSTNDSLNRSDGVVTVQSQKPIQVQATAQPMKSEQRQSTEAASNAALRAS